MDDYYPILIDKNSIYQNQDGDWIPVNGIVFLHNITNIKMKKYDIEISTSEMDVLKGYGLSEGEILNLPRHHPLLVRHLNNMHKIFIYKYFNYNIMIVKGGFLIKVRKIKKNFPPFLLHLEYKLCDVQEIQRNDISDLKNRIQKLEDIVERSK